MSREAIHRFANGTGLDGNESLILRISEHVLDRLLHPPDYGVLTGLAECALHFVQDGWGVYGFGLRRIQDSWIGDAAVKGETVITLTVDYAWLLTDLRERGARSPFISVEQANFARRELLRPLGLDLPGSAVLQGSDAPIAFSTGNALFWETKHKHLKRGVVGPPVMLTDGSGRTGYLTAGHVTPDLAKPNAEIGNGTGSLAPAWVITTAVPSPMVAGAKPKGSVDAAVITTDPSPTHGIGSAGSGSPNDAVTKVGGANASPGIIVGYDEWTVVSGGGLWKDNYSIEPAKLRRTDPRFAEPSDSGAAVLANSEVIGIVVGGANLVPGCSDSIIYVQDIDAICTDLSVSVLP